MKKIWGIIVVVASVMLVSIMLVCGAFLYGKSQSETIVKETVQYIEAENQADDIVAEEDFVLSINYIENTLLPASDLIVSRFNYKDADIYEDFKEINGHKIPLTTDKVVFTYEGAISLGIDFSQIRYQIDEEKKTIQITLPEVGIIANEIEFSSFEYYTVSDSIFNKNMMEETTELIDTLKTKTAARVLKDQEILQDVEQKTQALIRSLLETEEHTKEYLVVFR